MKKFFLLLFTLTLFASANAQALAGDPQSDDAASVFLVAGVDGVGQLGTVPLALDIRLAPGWHTYWRSPGEAGLPPAIDWKKSETDEGNLKSITLLYPAPKRYTAFGLETIGYRDQVLLPIDAELRTPGKALKLEATLDLLVCSQICVPKHYILKLTVPEGPSKDSSEAPMIKQFRDQIPGDAEKSGISISNLASDGQSLAVTIVSQAPLQAPDIFVEDSKEINFGAPSVTMASDMHSAQLVVRPTLPLPEGTSLAGMNFTLTVIDGTHALEQKMTAPGTPLAATVPPPLPDEAKPATLIEPATAPLPIGVVILFAIIGGFILNLMPCVLPVLSLKLLSVISHGGGEAKLVRQSFLVTAAGILFSFLILASMTIVLKEAGLAVGWGVQFQQPLFLVILILLLTFFAANMWGLFEISLPRWLADSMTGPYHPKLTGDFATGAFATLLATPCSAPFLGTAVGFALASGPQDILIIFLALGFGMSLPYLAVALWPRLATALPKPGHWMISLRHLLGWALAFTTLWLIWVLSAQVFGRSAFVVGICMLAILGLFALHRIRPRYYLNFGVASFALLAFGTVLAGSLAQKPPGVAIDAGWQLFDETQIARDVMQGKTVFVDVTADWCLTCKANQKLVLSNDTIKQRLFHSSVIPMQADWTNPDPVIAAFLQKYGRYGIPFNAAFGPGAPQGIVLPELLSSDAVIKALNQAEKLPQP